MLLFSMEEKIGSGKYISFFSGFFTHPSNARDIKMVSTAFVLDV